MIRALLLLLILFSSLPAFSECRYYDPGTSSLPLREGYATFISEEKLKPLKEALPHLSDSVLDAAMRSPDAMWYDEHSMVFLYQDSIESVVGGRANCVGRQIGENNSGVPGIAKLVNFFGSDYRFRFPFRKAAGTDEVSNSLVLNFWLPPKQNGRTLPVKWWKMSSRGRWRWTFPVGTIFGEVLYEQSPSGKWYPFEVRTRTRYLDGWDVNAFRPFGTASELAQTIKLKRPNWSSSFNLSSLISYLEDSKTLVPYRLESQAYGKAFEPINGALDLIPDFQDPKLVEELLTTPVFQSVEGKIWKEYGVLKTYAPGSKADFSIVPGEYKLGLVPVNEVSCSRCHSQTGRRLYDFDFDIQLYGEIWGEDQIFTWHLFEPHQRIWGPWDDADVSRNLNPRLEKAKLVEQGKPSAGDPIYKPLPTAFIPESFGTQVLRGYSRQEIKKSGN